MYRAKKFELKWDPDVVRSRWSALKEISVEQQRSRQAEMAELRDAVREILNEAGINPIFSAPYQAFALKLYGIDRSYSGNVRTNEMQGAYLEFKRKGCSETVLTAILGLFGVSPPSP